MTKAVVTGGAGFIGSHVTDLLIDLGWEVTVFDDLSSGHRSNVQPAAAFTEGSILDLDSLTLAVNGADYVFHLAALPRIQPSFDDPIAHEMVNVVGTINCVEAARRNPLTKKLVISSSSACYGTPKTVPTSEEAEIAPLSPYALQKYSAEQYSLILGARYDVPVVCLRYFNVYGPRSFNANDPLSAYSSVIGVFKDQANAGLPITVTGDGSQSRDFVHVRDVAQANLLASTSSISGEIFNVGSGRSVTVNELAAMFSDQITHIEERGGEARTTRANIEKIQLALGWEPRIDLEEGIAE